MLKIVLLTLLIAVSLFSNSRDALSNSIGINFGAITTDHSKIFGETSSFGFTFGLEYNRVINHPFNLRARYEYQNIVLGSAVLFELLFDDIEHSSNRHSLIITPQYMFDKLSSSSSIISLGINLGYSNRTIEIKQSYIGDANDRVHSFVSGVNINYTIFPGEQFFVRGSYDLNSYTPMAESRDDKSSHQTYEDATTFENNFNITFGYLF